MKTRSIEKRVEPFSQFNDIDFRKYLFWNSEPIGIDFGCGEDKFHESFYGVDLIDTVEADQQIDLDRDDWDLPENGFAFATARDLYEHLKNPIQFIDNTAKVLQDGGKLFIRSPHLCSKNWTDPTHKRLVGIETFKKFFTEEGASSYYSQSNWNVLERRITFRKRKFLPWNYVIQPIVNFNNFTQVLYERTLLGSLFPSLDVEVVMEVKK